MLERVRDWLQERRQKLDLFDETLVARQDNPLYLMGPMLYYFWLVTVVTGVILMLWYEPTTTGAYTSIERIQNDIGRLALTFLGRPVTLGGLTRGLHKYGADALITVTFLRIYRMYFLAEYKKPGELTWMLAFLGLILGMVSGITGYLLIWNQRAGGERPAGGSDKDAAPDSVRLVLPGAVPVRKVHAAAVGRPGARSAHWVRVDRAVPGP